MNRLADTLSLLFAKRWRGFRTVNLWACVVAVVLALGVYAFKADAGKESARIKEVSEQIQDERRAVTLLRAEVAHLEQPERLERLSIAYLGLKPQDARREAPPEGLTEVAHRVEQGPSASAPAPTAPAAVATGTVR